MTTGNQTPFQQGFSQFDPVADVLYGIRLFAIQRPTMQLTGQFARSYAWLPGKNTAKCVGGLGPIYGYTPPNAAPPHHAPHPPCGCGLWAYTKPPDGGPIYLRPQASANVVGIIKGWGRMVAGPLGFRCEFAQIVALAFPETSTPASRDVVSTAELTLAIDIADELKSVGLSRMGLENVPSPWSRNSVGGPATVDRIIRNYPSAAVFSDEVNMIREYPVSDLGPIVRAEQLPEGEA